MLSNLISVEYYLNLNYPFYARPLSEEEGAGWMVQFPHFEGIIGTGNTLEKALQDAGEAKNEWIKGLLADGKSIPLPYVHPTGYEKVVMKMPRNFRQYIKKLSCH